MKIVSLKAKNYRTLEDLNIKFSGAYSAICGPNDCGKTNVIRAIRLFVGDDSPFIVEDSEEGASFRQDYPKWRSQSTDQAIEVELAVEVDSDRDAALFQFIIKQLQLEAGQSNLTVSIRETFKQSAKETEPDVEVKIGTKTYDGLDAQEIRKRLRNSRAVLFHNSTEANSGLPFRTSAGVLVQAEKAGHTSLLNQIKKNVDRGLARLAKTHKQELEELLGRLSTKYEVGLSMPTFDFGSVPLGVTLGQKFQVPLNDWGSGTRNRTLVLMALFRARRMSLAAASAEKITPVIVIEEPESFLHPSAQAEFGRVLQDLAEEFGVQVIITTHSPYLLNLRSPESNILLARDVKRRQPQATRRLDTSGDKWMDPFAAALGLDSDEFRPWKGLLVSSASSALLVEGDTDKAYFELLRDSAHGDSRLIFDGDIIPYEGVGNLQNSILLKFVQARYQKCFITFDLDSMPALEKVMKQVGLERKKDFEPMGIDAPGKRAIEGLLPVSVTQAVCSDNHELVQALMSGEKAERESARNKLKALYLERFRAVAKPGDEYYGALYKVAKMVNRALR